MVEPTNTTLKKTTEDWRTSPIGSHHHLSFRCRDAEETRHYYEDFLGLELCAAIPSQNDLDGNPVESLYMLFRMQDGNLLGFHHVLGDDDFELPEFSPLERHLAMKVGSEKDWDVWVKRLTDEGIKFHMLDHDFVRSVYFPDPNGVWLEITYEVQDHDEQLRDLKAHAEESLDSWNTIKSDIMKKAKDN